MKLYFNQCNIKHWFYRYTVINLQIITTACPTDNDIVDSFQSAYKAGHSCETALLRVYNDIVTTVGKGNGAMLVLLDLSAAFGTIDHVIFLKF